MDLWPSATERVGELKKLLTDLCEFFFFFFMEFIEDKKNVE